MLAPFLLSWVLLGTVTTMQCRGTDCRPTHTSQKVVGPHRMSVFRTAAECEAYRQYMQQMELPATHSRARPDVTVRKAMTFTCAQSEGDL